MKSMQGVGWYQTEHLLAKSVVMIVMHPITVVTYLKKRNISYELFSLRFDSVSHRRFALVQNQLHQLLVLHDLDKDRIYSITASLVAATTPSYKMVPRWLMEAGCNSALS